MINVIERHWKSMSPKEFTQLKAMTNAGIHIAKITKLTGRTYLTLKTISEANDFTDYRLLIKQFVENRKKTKVEEKTDIEPVQVRNIEKRLEALEKAVNLVLQQLIKMEPDTKIDKKPFWR